MTLSEGIALGIKFCWSLFVSLFLSFFLSVHQQKCGFDPLTAKMIEFRNVLSVLRKAPGVLHNILEPPKHDLYFK